MYWHAPTRLRGPHSRTRSWWLEAAPIKSRGRRRPQPESISVDGVRLGLVARVRREIAEGSYDSADKWDAALDRLFAQLNRWA